jgi:hypothetical protein
MKKLQLTTVEQNPEVLKVQSAINELTKSMKSTESDRAALDKLVEDTGLAYRKALADFGLGKLNKDELASIELAMKEAEGKRHKFKSENNPTVLSHRKQALSNLEAELQATKDYAAQNNVAECRDFIESIRTDLKEPIDQIKNAIKELDKALVQMRNNSAAATISFKYEFALRNIHQIYNYLTVLENIGTDNLDSEFVQIFDSSVRFLDK